MPRYKVTISTDYEFELEELTPEIRKHIARNYEAPILPEPYTEAKYQNGSVTIEELENSYLVKFITDFVVFLVHVSAKDEEQAEGLAQETLWNEFGLELNN